MKIGKTAYSGLGVAEAYRTSGKRRADFCRERGLTLSTLDYYLRRDRPAVGNDAGQQHAGKVELAQQRLVPVRLVGLAAAKPSGLVVELGNGRRIEVRADFDEASLLRLIALLESH
jgi:hypothetical protein